METQSENEAPKKILQVQTTNKTHTRTAFLNVNPPTGALPIGSFRWQRGRAVKARRQGRRGEKEEEKRRKKKKKKKNGV